MNGASLISVVVPVLDESAEIEATLATTRDPAVLEVIVVDGGSRDATAQMARCLADRVISAPRGRASQMNAGAALARGEVLLFLHGDTWLPRGFGRAVRAAIEAGCVAGRFDVALRGSHRMLPVVAALINARSRLTRIATGDQAMFVRRQVFEALGRFPPMPLMEDVALSARLRRAGRVAALRARVSTSGRRWEEHGVARTVLLMWRLRLAYACGIPAERLARRYPRHG